MGAYEIKRRNRDNLPYDSLQLVSVSDDKIAGEITVLTKERRKAWEGKEPESKQLVSDAANLVEMAHKLSGNDLWTAFFKKPYEEYVRSESALENIALERKKNGLPPMGDKEKEQFSAAVATFKKSDALQRFNARYGAEREAIGKIGEASIGDLSTMIREDAILKYEGHLKEKSKNWDRYLHEQGPIHRRAYDLLRQSVPSGDVEVVVSGAYKVRRPEGLEVRPEFSYKANTPAGEAVVAELNKLDQQFVELAKSTRTAGREMFDALHSSRFNAATHAWVDNIRRKARDQAVGAPEAEKDREAKDAIKKAWGEVEQKFGAKAATEESEMLKYKDKGASLPPPGEERAMLQAKNPNIAVTYYDPEYKSPAAGGIVLSGPAQGRQA